MQRANLDMQHKVIDPYITFAEKLGSSVMRGAMLSYAVSLAVLVTCVCASSSPGDHTGHVVRRYYRPRVPEVRVLHGDKRHAGMLASASSHQPVSFLPPTPNVSISKRQRAPLQSSGGRQSKCEYMHE